MVPISQEMGIIWKYTKLCILKRTFKLVFKINFIHISNKTIFGQGSLKKSGAPSKKRALN